MKQKQTRELFSYWRELYREHGVPERSLIEPSAIRQILGDTFILEIDRNNKAVYRLAGTRLCAAFAIELKGMLFNNPWLLKEKETIQNIITAVGNDAIAALLGSTATSQRGRSISFETLILPLLHNETKNQRLIGITTPLTRPYWLGTDPIITQALSSMRIIDPNLSGEPFNARFTVMKSNKAQQILKIPNGRRVKHLMVVEGGKAKLDEEAPI